MNYIYTAFLYRNNGSDYCRGCYMGSTDSDLKIFQETSVESLFELILPIVVENTIAAKNDHSLCNYTIEFSINGIFNRCADYIENNVISTDQDIYNKLNIIQTNFYKCHDELLKTTLEEIENKKNKERQKLEDERTSKIIHDELLELQRLKEKYE